jgi:hypothetical protein
LAQTLHERQRQDWRELRFERFDAANVRRALERLAREIVKARRRPMSQRVTTSAGEEKRGQGVSADAAPAAAQARREAKEKAAARRRPDEETRTRSDGPLAPGTVFRDKDAPGVPSWW